MDFNKIYCGEARQVLATWPDQCVDMVVTSPPYYGLRDYGTPPQIWGGDPECAHEWDRCVVPAANGITHDGGMTGETLSGNSATRKPKLSDFCSKCGAWRGSFGLEPTPELYVEHTVLIFREIRRVLKDHGTIWINIGDSYSAQPGQRKATDKAGKKQVSNFGSIGTPSRCVEGLKPKDLLMIPARVALALQADGWYLRQDNIWNKPNPMPESVTDRCTKSHEYIYMLSKCQHYYYDNEAIKETVADGTVERLSQPTLARQTGSDRVPGKTNGPMKAVGSISGGRNHRSVWTINTKPYKGAHFATFPPELPETCILAGSSAKGVCPRCGKPWKRIVERGRVVCVGGSDNPDRDRMKMSDSGPLNRLRSTGKNASQYASKFVQKEHITSGWQPTCECIDQEDHEGPLVPVPAVVLDPFMGSGTTASVALANGRRYLGIELNPQYIELCEKRIGHTPVPLFMDA